MPAAYDLWEGEVLSAWSPPPPTHTLGHLGGALSSPHRKWHSGGAREGGVGRRGSWSCDWETELPCRPQSKMQTPSDPRWTRKWPSPRVLSMNTEHEGSVAAGTGIPKGLQQPRALGFSW